MANSQIIGLPRASFFENIEDFSSKEMFKEKFMKLIIYYDNGESYSANKVSQVYMSCGKLVYKHTKNKGHFSVDSTVKVSLDNVLAYKKVEGEETTIVKLKPCAVVKAEVMRKRELD